MPEPTRLGFVGDVMLGRLVDQHQRERPPEAVWGNVRERLLDLDGLFANLECCLSTRGERWTETYRPFHFRADPGWAIPALQAAGVDFANLANNHLMDYGATALLDTLEHLDDAGIAHAGAGRNVAAAREPALVTLSDLDVAVVSFTDNTPEFAARPDRPGTTHVEFDVDDDETLAVVGEALDRARADDPDLLVASLHWGPNMVEEPPEEFRGFARWLVEEGVDFVHGHSAHVFQGIEVVDGVPVCYDCGDFVDDYAVDDDLRNDRSFLFEVSVEGGRAVELRLFPTAIYDFSVHEAHPEVAEWSRHRMRELSAEFGTEFEREGGELVLDIE
jgi:poly-gamma-glutamate synthesis protein (capsule biosynthesis protein)